ncbi:MAG: hypothetical protein ACXVCN_04820 [Bdellovibrio sp.]
MYYEIARHAEYRPYETKVGREKLSLKANQCLVCFKRWASEILETSRTNVYDWLKRLEEEEIISVERRNGFAIVTLLFSFKQQVPTDIASTVTRQIVDDIPTSDRQKGGALSADNNKENANSEEGDRQLSDNISTDDRQPIDEASTGTKNISKNTTKNYILDSELDKSSSSSAGDGEPSQAEFPESGENPPENVLPMRKNNLRPETKAALGVWWFCRRIAILSCGVDKKTIGHSPQKKHIGFLQSEIKHWGQGETALGVAYLMLGFRAECEAYNLAMETGKENSAEYHFPLITKITRDRMGVLVNGKSRWAREMANRFDLEKFYAETYKQSADLNLTEETA